MQLLRRFIDDESEKNLQSVHVCHQKRARKFGYNIGTWSQHWGMGWSGGCWTGWPFLSSRHRGPGYRPWETCKFLDAKSDLSGVWRRGSPQNIFNDFRLENFDMF